MESFVQVLVVLIPIIAAILLSVSPLGRRSRLKELADSYSTLKGNGYDDVLALSKISDAISREVDHLQSKETKTRDWLSLGQSFAIWGMSFIAVSSVTFTAIYKGTEGLLDFLRGLGIVYAGIAFALGLLCLLASIVSFMAPPWKVCWRWIKVLLKACWRWINVHVNPNK